MPDAGVIPLTRLYDRQVPTPRQEAAQSQQGPVESEVAPLVAAYRTLGYAVPIVGGWTTSVTGRTATANG